MKHSQVVAIVLTVIMGALTGVQYVVFHTLSYTFTIVVLYLILLTIVAIYYNAQKMSRKKFFLYAGVLGACFVLLFSSNLLPLQIKSDYLEIHSVWYDESDDSREFENGVIKIYAKVSFSQEITDRFGSTTQIKCKIDNADGITATGTNLVVLPASHWQGKTTDVYLGQWGVSNPRGSFDVLVWIKSSNYVDASAYTVRFTYVMGESQDPPPDDPFRYDPSGDLWISQAKIEWSEDRKEFNLKVSAKNEYDERIVDVEFELDLPNEFSDPRGGTEQDADDIIAGQSRTVTFKDIRIGSAEVGEEYEIEITVRGALQESGKDVSDTATHEITITEPPEPSWSGDQDKYTEAFSEMFAAVMQDSMTSVTVACILLGTIAIIMGKSSGNRRAYMFGSLIAAFPVGFTILSLYFGWVPPAAYFIELAGPGMASFTQALITLVVLFMFLMVPYVLSDVIGSPYE